MTEKFINNLRYMRKLWTALQKPKQKLLVTNYQVNLNFMNFINWKCDFSDARDKASMSYEKIIQERWKHFSFYVSIRYSLPTHII